MNRKWFILSFLTLALLAGGIGYWILTAESPAPPQNILQEESEEEKLRHTLHGVWQDEYRGKRTMTLNEDGSGTMFVELSGLWARLYASKLRFDMKWWLNGKKLIKKSIRGEPAFAAKLILKAMGDTAEDSILEFSEDRLLLLDKDGKTRYDWRRAKKEATQ